MITGLAGGGGEVTGWDERERQREREGERERGGEKRSDGGRGKKALSDLPDSDGITSVASEAIRNPDSLSLHEATESVEPPALPFSSTAVQTLEFNAEDFFLLTFLCKPLSRTVQD